MVLRISVFLHGGVGEKLSKLPGTQLHSVVCATWSNTHVRVLYVQQYKVPLPTGIYVSMYHISVSVCHPSKFTLLGIADISFEAFC